MRKTGRPGEKIDLELALRRITESRNLAYLQGHMFLLFVIRLTLQNTRKLSKSRVSESK